MHMIKSKKKMTALALSLLLVLVAFLPLLSTNAQAATEMTSIGLAEHGLMAYRDGWVYNYGSTGQTTSNGTRMSDCSGLIYAYFLDNGTTGPRVVSQQAAASVQSGNLDAIPRIHGLLLSTSNYDHVGIYIGDGQIVDNSTYGVDMCIGSIYSRGWLQWHMMDAGVKYPVSGFYAFDGKMYHYSNRQYDINTTVTNNGVTYQIGADGIVCDSNGNAIPVDTSMPNTGYAKPEAVADVPSNIPENSEKATVIGSSVRVRSEASTTASVVTTLSMNSTIYLTGQVDGEYVSGDNGRASSIWYQCSTGSGLSGYITSVYVDTQSVEVPNGNTPSNDNLTAPAIAFGDNAITITAAPDSAVIYYTTDGTTPSESNGSIYVGALSNPLYTTYKAIAVNGGQSSPVSVLSILSTGDAFKDLSCGEWYYDYVNSAVKNKFFSGYGDNTFRPDKGITRAEFIQVLANYAGVDTAQYTENDFTDVNGGWYNGAISWAASKEIVSGRADGSFAPDQLITRQEMCVIITKLLDISMDGSCSVYDDEDDIDSWALDAVYACRYYGLMEGNEHNCFDPDGVATRSHVSKIITLINERF